MRLDSRVASLVPTVETNWGRWADTGLLAMTADRRATFARGDGTGPVWRLSKRRRWAWHLTEQRTPSISD
jgi:hypothetical protein